MDVLHGTLDTVASALGRPDWITALGVAKDTGSAAEVLLTYPVPSWVAARPR
jgi:hypothetical protein